MEAPKLSGADESFRLGGRSWAKSFVIQLGKGLCVLRRQLREILGPVQRENSCPLA